MPQNYAQKFFLRTVYCSMCAAPLWHLIASISARIDIDGLGSTTREEHKKVFRSTVLIVPITLGFFILLAICLPCCILFILS